MRKFPMTLCIVMLEVCSALAGCGTADNKAEETNTEESIDVDDDIEEVSLNTIKSLSEEPDSKENVNEEKVVAGIYTSQLPFRDYLTDSDSHMLETAGLTTLLDASLPFVLELNESGLCMIYVDSEYWQKEMTNCLMKDADRSLTEAFYREGVREEKFDKVARNAGYSSYEDLKSVFCNDYKEDYVNGFTQEILNFKMEGAYTFSDSLFEFQFPEEENIDVLWVDKGFEICFTDHKKEFKMLFER